MGLHQSSSARIDQKRPALDMSNILSADQMMRFLRIRRMQSDNVGSREKILERCVFEAQDVLQEMVLARVISQNIHAKPPRHLDDMESDVSGSHHAEGPAFEVESLQSLEGKIPADGADIRLMNVARQGQD